jgi:transcriptional regulator with PAS, ATPase and Fis domain
MRESASPGSAALASADNAGDLNALFLPTAGSGVTDELTLTKTKEKAEILRITEALNKHRNNRLRAAAELGISRMALYKKLHKYGLYNSA